MNGDGTNPGFIQILDQYGSTKSGNLAKYYLGICYLKTGDFRHVLKPQIKNFKGEIIQDSENNLKWIFQGAYNKISSTIINIIDYCPDMTYDRIEEHLNKLEQLGKIISFENNSKNNIDINVKFKKEDLENYSDEDLRKLLKLYSSETENLTLIDENLQVKIFTSVKDVIKYFIDFRLQYYYERKKKMIYKINREISILNNRIKFIQLISKNKIQIHQKSKDELIKTISDLKFDLVDESYEYLINLPMYSLTLTVKEKFENELKTKLTNLEEIKKISEKEMYINDLLELKKVL